MNKQPSTLVIVRANGESTNETVCGTAEHASGTTYDFRIELAPEPDPVCMAGGRIKTLRIMLGGQLIYLFANGARRHGSASDGLVDVHGELKALFN